MACIGCCSGAGGYIVAMLLCPVREKVCPARPDVCVSAKKFAQQAKNGPKSVFYGTLGEFFRGSAAVGAVLGEQFRGPTAAGDPVGRTFSRIGRWKPRVGRTFSRVWAWTPRLVWHVLGLAAVCKPWRHPRRVLWVPEGVSEGGGAVAPANLRRPTGTPCAPSCGALWNTSADLHRSHTQRIQKRPGPWPRALPATQELR